MTNGGRKNVNVGRRLETFARGVTEWAGSS